MRFAADKLGEQLVDQAIRPSDLRSDRGHHRQRLRQAQVVGADGGCNPNSPGCPKEYAYTEAAKVAFSAAFYRGVQRIAYEKLLPLGYRVYQPQNPRLPGPIRPRTPA